MKYSLNHDRDFSGEHRVMDNVRGLVMAGLLFTGLVVLVGTVVVLVASGITNVFGPGTACPA